MESDNMKSYIKIMFVLFIEGFVSLSFQMLYIRQLTPFVGNSVEVVSWIVGIFLIALAIGYKHGGNIDVKKKDLTGKLISNLFFAIIIAGFGLSFLFLELYFSSGILSSYLLMILYCIIIIFPTTYLLGQTLPLVTNIMQGNSVSEISGNVLFLSTVGSFLGALITTNILLKFFGVSATIFFNLSLLSFLILYLEFSRKDRSLIVKSITVSIVLIIAYGINIPIERENFNKTNQYANYKTIENGIMKIFTSNKSYSSILIGENKFGYIKFLEKLIFDDFKIRDQDILVIGAGGFLFSKNMEYTGNRFTYVDIDPEIKSIAEQYFLNSSINGEFVALDGRNFINQAKEQYGLIFLDAYSSQLSMPEHLLTKEFFKSVSDRLKDDGILVVNAIYKTDFKDDFSLRLNKTIKSVFGNCYVYPISPADSVTNVEYVCFKVKDVKEYTDDLNGSNSDFYKLLK